jgi:hypothetical protein
MGIQFDPDIVPVLVGLDRDILDRPPDNPDELPTMLHTVDPRDHSGNAAGSPAEKPAMTDAAAATEVTPPDQEEGPPSRPLLASDDVS